MRLVNRTGTSPWSRASLDATALASNGVLSESSSGDSELELIAVIKENHLTLPSKVTSSANVQKTCCFFGTFGTFSTRYPLPVPAITIPGGKIPLLRRERRRPNKPVISVCNPVYRVTGVTPVVRSRVHLE